MVFIPLSKKNSSVEGDRRTDNATQSELASEANGAGCPPAKKRRIDMLQEHTKKAGDLYSSIFGDSLVPSLPFFSPSTLPPENVALSALPAMPTEPVALPALPPAPVADMTVLLTEIKNKLDNMITSDQKKLRQIQVDIKRIQSDLQQGAKPTRHGSNDQLEALELRLLRAIENSGNVATQTALIRLIEVAAKDTQAAVDKAHAETVSKLTQDLQHTNCESHIKALLEQEMATLKNDNKTTLQSLARFKSDLEVALRQTKQDIETAMRDMMPNEESEPESELTTQSDHMSDVIIEEAPVRAIVPYASTRITRSGRQLPLRTPRYT